MQGVVDCLSHQQVVGDVDRTGGVLLTGGGLGEDRSHQVIRLHPLDGRRVALPIAEAQHHQRPVEVPPPAGLEHRRVQDGVLERVAHRGARHVPGYLVEREAVVRSERQHDGVVGGCSLQLEVEGAAELLPQRQTQAAVDAAPVGRVEDELHPAGVVEEPLQHEAFLGRHLTQHGSGDRQVIDDHRRCLGADAGGIEQPASSCVRITRRQELGDAAT